MAKRIKVFHYITINNASALERCITSICTVVCNITSQQHSQDVLLSKLKERLSGESKVSQKKHTTEHKFPKCIQLDLDPWDNIRLHMLLLLFFTFLLVVRHLVLLGVLDCSSPTARRQLWAGLIRLLAHIVLHLSALAGWLCFYRV